MRLRIFGPSVAGSMPSTRSVPDVRGDIQAIIRMVEVFPAPFGRGSRRTPPYRSRSPRRRLRGSRRIASPAGVPPRAARLRPAARCASRREGVDGTVCRRYLPVVTRPAACRWLSPSSRRGAELERIAESSLSAKSASAPRGETVVERCGDDRGRRAGVDGRVDRPAALAGVRDPAGEVVEMWRLGQGVSGEVEQPGGDHRAASPHLGHLGRSMSYCRPRVAQRRVSASMSWCFPPALAWARMLRPSA